MRLIAALLFALAIVGCNHESPLSKCIKGCNSNFKLCLTIPLDQRDRCLDAVGSCYGICSKIDS
jgi:hypothetical protein